MKEDHMRNGQLKPGYNVQAGTDAGYVVGIDISQERSDMNTLIPFMKKIERRLQYRYDNVVADAGYDSEENLIYLLNHKQKAYIKPATYEKSTTRRYRNDIGLEENMDYADIGDLYICHAGRVLYYEYERERRTKLLVNVHIHNESLLQIKFKTEDTIMIPSVIDYTSLLIFISVYR